MNESDNFALVPKTPTVLEKAEPGTKRVLSGMVADALILAKSGVKASETAGRPVSVFFSAEHIVSNLKARKRFAVIREIVTHLIKIGRIRPQDEEEVVGAIIKREKRMSTGFGFGYASPRGRVNCVKDITLAIGVSATGVEFDALDNQPVNIFALFVAPANSPPHEEELLRFGGEIAKRLHAITLRDREHLLHSNSVEEMWAILKPVYDASCV
jgi:nitrogen PTS system EIIA component